MGESGAGGAGSCVEGRRDGEIAGRDSWNWVAFVGWYGIFLEFKRVTLMRTPSNGGYFIR